MLCKRTTDDRYSAFSMLFFQCYLYKNQTGQAQIIATLLPSTAEGKGIFTYWILES